MNIIGEITQKLKCKLSSLAEAVNGPFTGKTLEKVQLTNTSPNYLVHNFFQRALLISHENVNIYKCMIQKSYSKDIPEKIIFVKLL